jgi:bifunctional ADP-heptose synthase (sugar kinase/adenylyltransferase)
VNSREKIVAVAALAERVKFCAAPGAKLVLAIGRFDLLSRETVRQLEKARAEDVVLVAGVVPQPGPDCLLPAEARAQLAASLATVDIVVIADARELRQSLPAAAALEVKFDFAPRLLARFRGSPRV